MSKNSPYSAGFEPVIKTIVIMLTDDLEQTEDLDDSIADLTDSSEFLYSEKKRDEIINRVLKAGGYSITLSQNEEELVMVIDLSY